MVLRVGIFGTGSFANVHANILARMENVSITAICGSTLEKAEKMTKNHPAAKAYSSVTEMLDNTQLDAAYICVPPFSHGKIEEALVDRSIPFFVEKPLSTEIETPTIILDAVTKKKLLTSVGYHFRYMNITAKAKELLQDRTIGMAVGQWMGEMPGVQWWKKKESSGGQLVEQTTHLIDLLRYLLGEVDEVNAVFANRFMHLKEVGTDVPDIGTVILKMKNGAIATINNTCMLPMSYKNGLEIYTDAGVLELSPNGLKEYSADQSTEYSNGNAYNYFHIPYQKETQAFIHAVQTGDASGILSSYEDAWNTQRITTAANRSAETGQPVRL
ncbi:MAG: Gfo/Idh/MocA family oxidoreductase [Neobacillus sp.]